MGKASNNEVYVCKRNPCEPEAQAADNSRRSISAPWIYVELSVARSSQSEESWFKVRGKETKMIFFWQWKNPKGSIKAQYGLKRVTFKLRIVQSYSLSSTTRAQR